MDENSRILEDLKWFLTHSEKSNWYDGYTANPIILQHKTPLINLRGV